MVADVSAKQRTRPEWLQQYELVGKIGEGTYGLVYLAKSKEPAHRWVYGCWVLCKFVLTLVGHLLEQSNCSIVRMT